VRTSALPLSCITTGVLHHDGDFATIARVTGQPIVDVFDLWPAPN
jgi:hypothetical protein